MGLGFWVALLFRLGPGAEREWVGTRDTTFGYRFNFSGFQSSHPTHERDLISRNTDDFSSLILLGCQGPKSKVFR